MSHHLFIRSQIVHDMYMDAIVASRWVRDKTLMEFKDVPMGHMMAVSLSASVLHAGLLRVQYLQEQGLL